MRPTIDKFLHKFILAFVNFLLSLSSSSCLKLSPNVTPPQGTFRVMVPASMDRMRGRGICWRECSWTCRHRRASLFCDVSSRDSMQFLLLFEVFRDWDDSQEVPQECGHPDAINLDRLGLNFYVVKLLESLSGKWHWSWSRRLSDSECSVVFCVVEKQNKFSAHGR